MNLQTFRLLLEYHRHTLKTVKIENYNHDSFMYSGLRIPGISSLSINTMDHAIVSSVIGDLISEVPRSLKHLSLGAEAATVKKCRDPFVSEELQVNSNIQKLVDSIEEQYHEYARRRAANDYDEDRHRLMERGGLKNPWLQLDSCELSGLDASMLMNPNFALLDVKNLNCLNLMNCSGLERAFAIISMQGNLQGQSNLKLRSFGIRHQTFDTTFRPLLSSFIRSLPGLTNLAVLLETPRQPPDYLRSILKPHGKSLETLVWDERIAAVEFQHFITPSTPCSQIRDIKQCCPYLVELGILMDWRIFSGSDQTLLTRLVYVNDPG